MLIEKLILKFGPVFVLLALGLFAALPVLAVALIASLLVGITVGVVLFRTKAR